MKIGIVTYVKTATCNYGAELQSYALQYKLNSMGYRAEVLDLHRVLPGNNRFIDTIKKAIYKRYQELNVFGATCSTFGLFVSVLKDKFYLKFYSEKFNKKKKLFHNFFYSFISHSEKEYYPNELDYVKLDYDVYIAGSDQIWNYKNSDRVDVFFLMFANRFKAKKISYAASFSVSEIPFSYHDNYKKWINNIEYLSVRETAGQNIVNDLTGRYALLVCDPTLLLNHEEWMRQFPCSNTSLIEGKYIVIYSMSRSKKIFEIAEKVATKLGINRIVNIKVNFTPTNRRGVIDLYDVDPPTWVYLINNADFVVTDSFHGTAFSINFNKQFITFQKRTSELNSRVNTILTKLNLCDRICYDEEINKLPLGKIDYDRINMDIEEWRNISIHFLISSLDNNAKNS